MGFGASLRRIFSVMIVVIAVFVGWLLSHEQPLGVFFATVFPLMKGKIPSTLIGHGKMTGVPAVPDDLQPQPRPAKELFLTLPGNHSMPQNGLGMCCRYSAYDDELVRRTVLHYLLQGGRLIDTAHLYLNHKAIGRGIKEAIARGVPREEIFVTTKVFPSDFGYNRTITLVPTFLDELGLDYIDLVLMHFPVLFPMMKNDCKRQGISDADCRKDTWRALSELETKGVVRNVGVSNFAVHHLKPLQEMGLSDIAVNQIQYNPWAPDHMVETFEYCQDQGIAVTAYYSLGGTLQHAQAHTVQVLTDLAAKHNRSVAQIMLRWALQIGAAIIPGTGNPAHMRENLAVYDFELSAQDMEAIDSLRSDESAKKFFYMAPVD